MNSSNVVMRSAASKCWTTVPGTPAASRRSSRSAGSRSNGGAFPVRISSGWLSNVTTAGRAPRASAPATRCSRRYWWPRWSPSNTPTTTKIGPRSAVRASMPWTTAMRPGRAASGIGGDRLRSDTAEALEHLRGGDPSPVARPDADDRAALVEEPDRGPFGQARDPRGRTDEAALAGIANLVGRQHDGGQAIEAGIGGEEQRREGIRAIGGGRTQPIHADGVL